MAGGDPIVVGCQLRPAGADDAEALRPLLGQLGYVMDVDALAHRLAHLCDDPTSPVWMVEWEGRAATPDRFRGESRVP